MCTASTVAGRQRKPFPWTKTSAADAPKRALGFSSSGTTQDYTAPHPGPKRNHSQGLASKAPAASRAGTTTSCRAAPITTSFRSPRGPSNGTSRSKRVHKTVNLTRHARKADTRHWMPAFHASSTAGQSSPGDSPSGTWPDAMRSAVFSYAASMNALRSSSRTRQTPRPPN